MRFLVEESSQASSKLSWICRISWVRFCVLDCRQARLKPIKQHLQCFDLTRLHLDFAKAVIHESFLDFAESLSPLLAVCFALGSARSTGTWSEAATCFFFDLFVYHAGDIYAQSSASVRRWNVIAAPQ